MFAHSDRNGRILLWFFTAILAGFGLSACSPDEAADQPASVGREEVERELCRAVEFFRSRVSNQGGYHFRYSSDLSYGRSESAEGLSQVTVQRGGTPVVGMAYLQAYEVTRDVLYLEGAREAALVLARGQHCSGGWDYIIELDPTKRNDYPYRVDGDCLERYRPKPDGAAGKPPPQTTLDDNVTQAAVRLLMRVDRELKFQDEVIHEAALYALDQLILAQYPNGAWPQRYFVFPDPDAFSVKAASFPDSWPRVWPGPDYRSHYTLNDNAMLDMIDAFLEAARIYGEPRYRVAAEKGGDFLLLAQMPEPQPAWAQQYDVDMHPAWGRIFEPPSVTGSESQAVLKVLLVLYRETGKKKYLEPIPRAIDYLQRSGLDVRGSSILSRSRGCSPDELCVARFYELRTNRPLFISKGSRVRVRGGKSELLDGYELTYSNEKVITHYGLWTSGRQLDQIAEEHRGLLSADPSTVRRPERLHGLSPWEGGPSGPSDDELVAQVRETLASLDSRGAWVEEGNIGKADNVVSLFAAEEMVVTIGDQVLPLRENQTLSVFRGEQRPLERIISSNTFARNVGLLVAYLGQARRP